MLPICVKCMLFLPCLFPSSLNKLFQLSYHLVYFLFCVVLGEGKAYRHHRCRLLVMQCLYYMTNRVGATCTGAATAHAYARHIQAEQQHVRFFGEWKRYIKHSIQAATIGIAIKGHSRECFHQFGRHVFFQSFYLLAVCFIAQRGYFQRFRKAHYAIKVLGAGTHITFLRSSVDVGLNADILIYIQNAHALGAMKFMPGCTQEVHMHALQIKGIMPYRLHRVAVKNGIVFFTKLAYRFYFQQVSYFIISMLQTDKDSV